MSWISYFSETPPLLLTSSMVCLFATFHFSVLLDKLNILEVVDNQFQ